VKGIRIRKFRRIRKSRNIRIQPLCNEYFYWVLYLPFEEENYPSFLCMIIDWMWLGEFSWGRSVYVTLKIRVESMKVSCILILAMENG
jgi:hypothetical protein